MVKEFNILGDTRRTQWHSIVSMVRLNSYTQEGINALCDELDRYIDCVEDILEDMENEK